MIRINLAKTSAFPSEGEEHASGGGGGISLPSLGSINLSGSENPILKVALVLVFPLAVYIWEYQGLSGFRVDLAQKELELTQVANDIAQFGAAGEAIADVKIERDRLQKKLEVIAKISSKRAFKIRTLAKLQELIPQDCWLKEIDMKASQITFQGFARTPTSVQIFVDQLSSLEFLTKVINTGVSRKTLGETTVHEFSIVADLSKL